MKTRILLVDDHQMFREGLRAILERSGELQVVGEAADGRTAVEMATASPVPQLVIMDIGMPGLNGAEATREILARSPQTRVIALSGHADRRFVAAMLEAGASGYVLKEAASEEILHAVQEVLAGRKFLCGRVAHIVVDGYLNRESAGLPVAPCPLAQREREVLQLLAEGATSKQIARALHISAKTVEVHRRNIMAKLKLHSVAELTKYAVREGITSI